MDPIEMLYHLMPALALFAIIEILPLMRHLKDTATEETYPKMYNVWLTILSASIFLHLGFIFEVFFQNLNLYKFFEFGGMLIFIGAVLLIRRGIISVGVLMGVTAKLQDEVTKKTKDLKAAKEKLEEYSKTLEQKVEERTLTLQEKVTELTDARTALINMMEDVETANKFLRDSVSRLKEVDRMKDQLLSNVSHELRTPITIVKSALELMQDDEVTEEQEKLITMSKNNLNRLDALVGDLLYFSKGEEEIPDEELESVSMKNLVDEAVAGMSHMAQTNKVVINTSVAKNLPSIEASRQRLLQVFTNLLGNGIKFNKENGSITVRASHIKGDDKVSVSVSDTGVGIHEKELNKIFERFYQIDGSTSRKYGGTGLGLAITKNIIDAHGGELWVESTVGKGTTFYMTLPILQRKKYIVTLPLGGKHDKNYGG